MVSGMVSGLANIKGKGIRARNIGHIIWSHTNLVQQISVKILNQTSETLIIFSQCLYVMIY